MGSLRRLIARIARQGRAARLESGMDEEMRFHLEQETAERIRLGMTPTEARRTAWRDFGGLTQQKEGARAVRGLPWVDELVTDLRFAFRGIRLAPGASTAAILTLALGVGAATVTITAVRGILLAPLPYPAADRLVVAWEANVARNRWANSVAVTNFEAWSQRNSTFAGLAALVPDEVVIDFDRPARIGGAAVSPDWFRVVATEPALGRAFTVEEAVAGAAVMVLSDELWRERFGADPGIVGRTVAFQDRRFLITGVMPAGFRPPAFAWIRPSQRYWVPFAPGPANRPWGRSLLVIGRLREGISIGEARADLAQIMTARAREAPEENRDWTATVQDLRQEMVGKVRTPLLVLLAAVAALLGTTTVNLIAITVARIRRREGEFALRIALGAPSSRLLRQLAAESLAVAAVAAPAGAALAWAGLTGIRALDPVRVPRLENLAMSGAVAVTAGTIALAAALTAAIAAGLRLREAGLIGSVATLAGRTTRRLGGRLVVAEMALALVLTVGATLAMRSFVHLRSTTLGFTTNQVIAARVSLPAERYDARASLAFFTALEERLRRQPGIEQAGVVSLRPIAGTSIATTVFPGDRTVEQRDAPVADIRLVSAGFFLTLDIPATSGRLPLPAPPGAEQEIVVTAALARSLWPGKDPLGRTTRINLNGGIAARVVGTVADLKLLGPAADPRATVFLPLEGLSSGEMDLIVRTRRPDDAVEPGIRAAVAGLDPSLPIDQIESLPALLTNATSSDRLLSYLLAGYSTVAVLLAAVGVAGVLLIEVGQRRRELGVRMALGADTARLRMGVVRWGIELGAIGIAVGLVGAWYLTRFMRDLLHGVSPSDPGTFAMVAIVLLAVAFAATLIPAARATRVDPMDALRSE